MHGINQSAITLKDELEKIRNWAFQCKMGFNTDINKQEQESNHPSLTFNGTSDNQPEIRKKKHLGTFLDCKLDFKEQIQNMLNEVCKTTRLLRKLQIIS